jgi:hypothetical protein
MPFLGSIIWKRHIYLFSAASELGFNVMSLILDMALKNQNISFPTWWGTGGRTFDGCPLSCYGINGNYSCATSFDIYTRTNKIDKWFKYKNNVSIGFVLVQ